MGTLIANQFIDQRTGEDRRCIRFRVLKLLTENDFEEMKRILQLTSDSFHQNDYKSDSESISPESVPSNPASSFTETGFPPTIKRNSFRHSMQSKKPPKEQQVTSKLPPDIQQASTSSGEIVNESHSLPPTIIRKRGKTSFGKKTADTFPPRQPSQFLRPDNVTGVDPFNSLPPDISPANITSASNLLGDETGWETIEQLAKTRKFR